MQTIECDCAECDPNYRQEYQAWKESVDKYAKEHNLHEMDVAHIYAHMPISLLRLPCCKKGRKHDLTKNLA